MPISKAKHVPSGFEKYFRVGSLQEFVDEKLTTSENTNLVEEFTEKTLEALGYHFCGWAFAKDSYIEILANSNIATLAIVRKGRSTRELWDVDVVSGNIHQITLDDVVGVTEG